MVPPQQAPASTSINPESALTSMIPNLTALQVEQALGLSGITLMQAGSNAPTIVGGTDEANAKLKTAWERGTFDTPPAKKFQVRVWLCRNGVNPATITDLIATQEADGPARWEAIERWNAVEEIPVTHSMVAQLFAALQQAGQIDAKLTLPEVWLQILEIV